MTAVQAAKLAWSAEFGQGRWPGVGCKMIVISELRSSGYSCAIQQPRAMPRCDIGSSERCPRAGT